MLRLLRSDEDSLHWASHSTSWLRLSPELLLLGGVWPGSACFRQTQSAPAGRVQCTPPHCTLGQLYNMYNNENRICNFNITRSFYILQAGAKAILKVCHISRNISTADFVKLNPKYCPVCTRAGQHCADMDRGSQVMTHDTSWVDNIPWW